MKKTIQLLDGPIFPSLTKLALPVVGASLVQMAYNMVDMIWIGRVGSNAVAAVGAAGMYLWLSNGIASLSKVGGQIKVAHSLGAGDHEDAAIYARSALQLGIFTGVLFGILAVLLHGPLIGFFNLNSPEVIGQAEIYLMITSGLVVFNFINTIMTGIITAMGNSQTPFLATCMGLGVNFLLDPVLIFGMGPFPEMGVAGAALATILAQAIVTFTLAFSVRKDRMVFDKIHLLQKPDRKHMATIVRIGVPMSLQSMIFTFISMIIARIIAEWGDAAVAVQKVGNQIESISWMAADGFSAAVNSFIGQNYGAGNMRRVRKGYRVASVITIVWGIFCTAILLFLPQYIFRIFIPEQELVPMGVEYLQILGMSEIFLCMEIMTTGAFSGLGKTIPPAVESVVLTSARIPMALILSGTALGLNGIWWSISISSFLKGVVLVTWFIIYLSKLKRKGK
ncbi:MATE family efflux transporter [Lacrimispora saccharolytica]|nr:MATE family efflux transporter [Lacrimispora saccharolytica]